MPCDPSSRRIITLATTGAYLCLFLLGFADNLKGPTLPALLGDLRLDYAQGAAILLAAQIGFTLATLAAGVLADRIGPRKVVLITGGCMFLGAAAYSQLRQPGWLMLAMLLMGLGFGSLNVSGNSLVIAYHADQKGRYLNQMNVFHGLAAMAAPFFAGQMLAGGSSWRAVYQVALLPISALLIYFFFLRLPWNPRSSPGQKTEPSADKSTTAGNWRKASRSAATTTMLLIVAIGFFYVAAEIGAAAWMVEFLQKVKGLPVSRSALFLSLFWGAIMTGRLLGSLVVERVGYRRAILIMALGVCACMAIGTFGPPALAFFLPLSGLFYSIIFPTTIAAVSSHHPENVNTIVGLLLTAAGIGGALGSGSVGFASNQVGIALGFGITTLYSLFMLVAAFFLERIVRTERKTRIEDPSFKAQEYPAQPE